MGSLKLRRYATKEREKKKEKVTKVYFISEGSLQAGAFQEAVPLSVAVQDKLESPLASSFC